ncbi:hypothetical protein F5144DRAFT_159885 [Chaetomium tenue]|uniref:Uncharacterized protein n=1 Tax=Chaetomium tenue TaxID=1854479 RepID=A0ACB7PC14_9PEZI|nr:hypothetical protein F5144DRAFT_159885 [Chaetomium globosum]
MLHDTLDRNQHEPAKAAPVVVLHGMGGVGKTEIAREYANQLEVPYAVYCITCEDSKSVTESYRYYVQETSETPAEILVEKFAQQVRELEKPWLIIFDNVDDIEPEAFQRLGPEGLRLGKGRGSFLLTTQSPRQHRTLSDSTERHIEVKPMDRKEAEELLLRTLGKRHHDPAEVSAFINLMGGLPLGLVMAAKTFFADRTPAIALDLQSLVPLVDQLLSSVPSFRHEYFSCLACLQADGISTDLLEEYQRCASLTTKWKEAEQILLKSALIRRQAGCQITIHQALQDGVRNWLRKQGRLESVAGLVMKTVANVYFAKAYSNQKSFEDLYAQHVEAMMKILSTFSYNSLETLGAKARLFHARGTFLLSNDMPTAAEEALRTSLTIYDSLPDSRHQQLALVSRLATACRAQGLDDEAKELEGRLQEAEIRSTRSGERVMHTAEANHIENGVYNQEADSVEIESVLSNLPSLTAGSTISSALTLALIEDIKADVLTILTKDEDLHELLRETPKRITHEKFQRNFLRLFRGFLSDIRKQLNDGEAELRQVIRVLRYQSRNIASHICQEIFDLKEQSEALLSLAQQIPDKGGQLSSFFGDDSNSLELAAPPKDEPLEDGESSGGESEEPEAVRSHSVPLGELEIIILESKSFLTFRERYRAFLFPRPDPQPLEAVIPADNNDPKLDSDDPRMAPEPSSEPLEPAWGPAERSSFVEEGYEFVRMQIRRLIRPRVKEGWIKIEWKCDCGDELYADFPESDADTIRQLEAYLKGHTTHAGGGTPPTQTSHSPGGGAALAPASRSPPLQPPSHAPPNNAGQPPSRNQPPATTGGATQANTPAIQATKRFLELCVNTGEFQRQLAEIDISTVCNDEQLFDHIRSRYHEVRSFRTKFFLLKPVDVHFVQFSVEDRHRVGILDKPLAIPSAAEMAAEGYAYYPCPLRPPPIPPNIFLHHLSKPGRHPRLVWGNRIPQKLHRSILQVGMGDELVVGWGVHIIEGLNKSTVLVCSLVGLVISGIVAVVWTVVRDDVQGGFGIGAWLTSVQAIVVMLVITKWLET